MKGMGLIFIIMILGLAVATLWDQVPIIKTSVHLAMNPTAGWLLDWNISIGFLIFTAVITLITTLLQKYATDQSALKTIKEEQKLVQEEMKLAKESPGKQMELSKKSMELMFKAMPITMRPVIYTSIPFILFIRWFGDYFTIHVVKIFGFMNWLLAYIILTLVFSIIFRKVFKVY